MVKGLHLLERVLPGNPWVLSIQFNHIGHMIALPWWTASHFLTSILQWVFQCLIHSRCFRNICDMDKRLRSRSLAFSQLMKSVKNYIKTIKGRKIFTMQVPLLENGIQCDSLGGNVVCIAKILHSYKLWGISRWERKDQRLLIKANTF